MTEAVAMPSLGRSTAGRLVACVLAAVAAFPVARAQMYTPDPRITLDMATTTFFGSTKGADGHFLSGVTAQFKAGNVTFVMTTDDAGRFKVHVPKYIEPAKITFSCSKPGYTQVSAIKRPPPAHATTPVQADCVLSPVNAGAK